jgi:hypothetical protein
MSNTARYRWIAWKIPSVTFGAIIGLGLDKRKIWHNVPLYQN